MINHVDPSEQPDLESRLLPRISYLHYRTASMAHNARLAAFFLLLCFAASRYVVLGETVNGNVELRAPLYSS